MITNDAAAATKGIGNRHWVFFFFFFVWLLGARLLVNLLGTSFFSLFFFCGLEVFSLAFFFLGWLLCV
jgi:hypothetical protein